MQFSRIAHYVWYAIIDSYKILFFIIVFRSEKSKIKSSSVLNKTLLLKTRCCHKCVTFCRIENNPARKKYNSNILLSGRCITHIVSIKKRLCSSRGSLTVLQIQFTLPDVIKISLLKKCCRWLLFQRSK